MSKLSSLPPIDEILMRKEREIALQQNEKEYWEHFASDIHAVKKVYELGRTECILFGKYYKDYSENTHYLYWKRLFGDLIFNVQESHGIVGIKITFGI